MTMAQASSPPVLTPHKITRSYSEQVAELRAIKDKCIGHLQNKEEWVEKGILGSILQALQGSAPSHVRTEEDSVRLLCLELLASISGGKYLFSQAAAPGANVRQGGHNSLTPFMRSTLSQQSYLIFLSPTKTRPGSF